MKLNKRRHFLSMLGIGTIGTMFSTRSGAHHSETHFDEQSAHRLVFQCNKADPDYLESLLFACAELLRKYGDDIELVIAAFGPGINLIAERPVRPVSKIHQQRARSLHEYGVRFQACGNTMKSLKWSDSDVFAFAEHVPIGIDGVMQLQEEGFSYISL